MDTGYLSYWNGEIILWIIKVVSYHGVNAILFKLSECTSVLKIILQGLSKVSTNLTPNPVAMVTCHVNTASVFLFSRDVLKVN